MVHRQKVCLLVVYLSICLSIYLSIQLSIYLSIYLSICLSIYLAILFLNEITRNNEIAELTKSQKSRFSSKLARNSFCASMQNYIEISCNFCTISCKNYDWKHYARLQKTDFKEILQKSWNFPEKKHCLFSHNMWTFFCIGRPVACTHSV